MSHVDIIYLACSGPKYAKIITIVKAQFTFYLTTLSHNKKEPKHIINLYSINYLSKTIKLDTCYLCLTINHYIYIFEIT